MQNNNQLKDGELFDKSHCTQDAYYEGKLLVIKPTSLIEEYRTSDFQLFYATAGFGCDPNKLGTKVFGFFLKDDDECSFDRSKFFGVIDEKYIPEWAKEKLEEYNSLEVDDSMKGLT